MPKYRIEVKMVVKAIKTVECDSYEEAEEHAKCMILAEADFYDEDEPSDWDIKKV